MIEKEKPELCTQIQGWATSMDRDRGGGQGTHSGGQRQEEGDRVGGTEGQALRERDQTTQKPQPLSLEHRRRARHPV